MQPKKVEPWPDTGLDRALARGRERKREREEVGGEDGTAGGRAEVEEAEEWTHVELEALEVVLLAVGHSRAVDVITKGATAEAAVDATPRSEVDAMGTVEAAEGGAEDMSEGAAGEVKGSSAERLSEGAAAEAEVGATAVTDVAMSEAEVGVKSEPADVTSEAEMGAAAGKEVDATAEAEVGESAVKEAAMSEAEAEVGESAVKEDAMSEAEAEVGASAVKEADAKEPDATSEALMCALRSLATRRDEPRGVKRACDAMLLGWLRHTPHATRAPLLPPALHSIASSVVRRAFGGDAPQRAAKRPRAKDPSRATRIHDNVVAVGFHPRPKVSQ